MSAFFGKKSTFTQRNGMRPTLETYWLFSVFVRSKVILDESVSFIDHAKGMRLPDICKLAVNWKKDNDVTVSRHKLSSNFFGVAVFLSSSLVSGPSFMSIS